MENRCFYIVLPLSPFKTLTLQSNKVKENSIVRIYGSRTCLPPATRCFFLSLLAVLQAQGVGSTDCFSGASVLINPYRMASCQCVASNLWAEGTSKMAPKSQFSSCDKRSPREKKHQKSHVFLLLFTTRFSLEPFSLKLVGCTAIKLHLFSWLLLKVCPAILMVWVVVAGEVHSTSTSQLKTRAPCCNCKLEFYTQDFLQQLLGCHLLNQPIGLFLGIWNWPECKHPIRWIPVTCLWLRCWCCCLCRRDALTQHKHVVIEIHRAYSCPKKVHLQIIAHKNDPAFSKYGLFLFPNRFKFKSYEVES